MRDLKQEVFSKMEKDRQAKFKLKRRNQKFEDDNMANPKSDNKMTYPL